VTLMLDLDGGVALVRCALRGRHHPRPR
jgi:hypothetical protein